MAVATGAPSFDEIIQAARQRRKNQQLASEIFGKNRHANGAGNTTKKGSRAPTIAKRVGIAKRSSSTSLTSSRVNPFGQPKPPSRPSSAAAEHARANRLASAVNDAQQVNILRSPPPRKVRPGSGFSIKGTAGPFVVQASNFAPGTTAEDIRAAIEPVATDSTGNNGMMKCRILTETPTVMAEMVFSERCVAEKVVLTFDDQPADGRILRVQLKEGSPSPGLRRKKSEPALIVPDSTPVGTSKDLFEAPANQADDVEMSTETSYNDAREVADQDRRSREDRRTNSDVQDGRYGFGSGRERNLGTQTPREALPSQGGADQRMDKEPVAQRRVDLRERPFDSRYGGRRDERSSYRRDSRYDGYRRDDRPSHYGNGLGSKVYRGNDSYGRMYSDDMIRGPPTGSRGGGLRDGYR